MRWWVGPGKVYQEVMAGSDLADNQEHREVLMSSKSEVMQRNLSGKVYDPVFLCMIGAIVLAVGTSVVLRAMAGGGPAAAYGAGLNQPRVQPVNGASVPVERHKEAP